MGTLLVFVVADAEGAEGAEKYLRRRAIPASGRELKWGILYETQERNGTSSPQRRWDTEENLRKVDFKWERSWFSSWQAQRGQRARRNTYDAARLQRPGEAVHRRAAETQRETDRSARGIAAAASSLRWGAKGAVSAEIGKGALL